MSPSAQSNPDMAVRDISQQILQIITEYSLEKFHDSKDRLVAGTPKFLSVIGRFIEAQEPVETCLPSFPFKSANQVYKVFGTLPDKAEELALERLNTMCLMGKLLTSSTTIVLVFKWILITLLELLSQREALTNYFPKYH
ncbi:hypothetical protein K4F52_001998 [Lecanicillium sp. MT-2017a]|nr:hypothetical protein K4F52_001998 [Lecanicillium sp. MT-2017a]